MTHTYYLLKIENCNLFLGDTQGITGLNIVGIKKKAMKFSFKDDNPKDKLDIWNAASKRHFNSEVKFEIFPV